MLCGRAGYSVERALAKGSEPTAIVESGGGVTPLGEFGVRAESDPGKSRKLLRDLIEAGFKA